MVSVKIPNYDEDYINDIKHMTYLEFHRLMLNFQRHNENFKKHFYIDFLGRGHFKMTCKLCAKKDEEIKEQKLKFLQSFMDMDSNSDSLEPCQSQITSKLIISNKNHTYNSSCC